MQPPSARRGAIPKTTANHVRPDEVPHQAVLEHVAASFERHGIHRARMVKIADEAGISRQALYRLFPNRQALVDAVFVLRVRQLVEEVQPESLAERPFHEAILEGAIRTITITRRTPDLLRLAYETTVGEASKMLLRPNAAVLELSGHVWQPIIDSGRARGEVRPDLDDEDFIEWISTINFMYAIREDLPTDRIRTLLHRHLIPAAVSGAEKLIP